MDASVSFGNNELKLEQHKALKAFVEGRDVFVALPTGYGKSLCYALLPAIFDSKKELVEKNNIHLYVSFTINCFDEGSVYEIFIVCMPTCGNSIVFHYNNSVNRALPDPLSFPS